MSKYAAVNVKFGADISQFSTAMQNAARQMKKAGDQLQSVGRSMTMNLTAPIVALGAAALYSFGQIDALKRGLISFTGSAALAEEEFNKLREVAKLPGIGLEEAVRGSINLQAIGMNADKARLAMKNFGNAIATVGGGKESFDLAIRGFGQLMNAARPLQQDLYQIANQLPQVNKLMIEAFGTNRAEDLAAMGISGKQLADFLVTELGKLPKVTGGIKNAFENMSDSIKISLASFGESLNKAFNIEGKINSLSDWLGSLADGFKNLDPTVQKFILGALGVVAALGPLSFVIGGIITLLPTLITGFAALGTAITFMTGPIGIAIVGLTALGIVLYHYLGGTDELERSEAELAKTINTANSAFENQKTKLDGLFKKLQDSNLGQAERNKLINEFNAIAGTNLKNITDETQFQKELAGAYKLTNEQLIAKKFNTLKAAQAEKEAALDAINLQIEIAKETAKRHAKEPIKDLFGIISIERPEGLGYSEEDKGIISDLEKKAFAAKNAVVALKKELYTISPSGKVAEITKPIIPPFKTEPKKDKPDKDKLFNSDIEGLKDYNKNLLAEMERRQDYIDNANSKTITNQLAANVSWKATLDNGNIGISEALDKSIEKWRQWQERIKELNSQMGNIITTGIKGAITDLATAFGENLVDGDPFKDLGNVILGSLGKLMMALGAEMIVMSSLGVAFQALMTNPATWGAAIPVGIAMVAAGAAISKIAAKGMQPSDGGGSTYSSGSGGGGGNYGSQSGQLVLQTRLDGRDLVLSGERTSQIIRR